MRNEAKPLRYKHVTNTVQKHNKNTTKTRHIITIIANKSTGQNRDKSRTKNSYIINTPIEQNWNKNGTK